MKRITAFYTREEYTDFVENKYLEHEVVGTTKNEKGEEIIETDMRMTDEEFLKLLPHLGR